MPLSTAQLPALKAAILADGTLSALPNTSDANITIAAAFNAASSPAYWVWRTAVLESEFTRATSVDGTNWSWPTYIARSQGERDAWARLFMGGLGGANPSLPNVRQAFVDIFSGAGGASQRTHLQAVSRRVATRAEQLYATGTGSTGSPGVAGFEGVVSYVDVENARNS